MPDEDIGALYLGNRRCRFRVWAPKANKVEVRLVFPTERTEPLKPTGRGYWIAVLDHIAPGARYYYFLDGEIQRPDPASHYQPEGVHKFSEVFNHHLFAWSDEGWEGIPLEKMVLYELHVGTFTPEGTFYAVIPRLEQLKELGVNTLSLMPVAQFPGERNWGYDGVYPFAVQNSYGGPAGLKELVNTCHQKGLAVILDVVYNHLGPEGNYLHDFGPYFTSKYQTPWGDAVNFDDAGSDEVRGFFIRNALHWFDRFHIDGLRLDAVHAITDMSARPFLKEVAGRIRAFNCSRKNKVVLIAESDLNDPVIIRSEKLYGFGLDAQWCDDFHHALHALLTGEKSGYYADFGKACHLAKSLQEGYVLTGEFSVFRCRQHGESARNCPASKFVVFTQNHDQTGNRMLGERLASLVPLSALKLAAGVLICSPYVPMLFMGEEYGEISPFLYFVSHGDPDLVEAVRRGRRREFSGFADDKEFPDPQSKSTFARSRLRWDTRSRGTHKIMLDTYRSLFRLRNEAPALSRVNNRDLWTQEYEDNKILLVLRGRGEHRITLLMNFSSKSQRQKTAFPPGFWHKIWDSDDIRWGGPGETLPERISGEEEILIPAWAFAVYESEAQP
jgi:maltooligosyltrehalose trehalohydrolase